MIKLSKHGSSLQSALYYVRLKTHDSSSLFGSADSAEADYSSLPVSFASIVAEELLQATLRHRGVQLDQWVIEPNSLHALVSLHEIRPQQETKGKPRLLTAFVAELKAATAKRINLMRNQPGSPVWQRSYKEQLVEDDMMLFRLQKKLSESDSCVLSS
ncbi:MAG: hypothetical protein AAFP20_06445 [Cyanobacteria bacterium J06614_10]